MDAGYWGGWAVKSGLPSVKYIPAEKLNNINLNVSCFCILLKNSVNYIFSTGNAESDPFNHICIFATAILY